MRFHSLSPACALLVACNAPLPPGSTGGTTEPAGPCGRGVSVVHSDHSTSANVSLVAHDGRVLSPSFLSSAVSAVGLSAPLSGDLALPTGVVPGAELVLLDRYPASVISWVNVETANVRAQLDAGERTNPHDYVAVSEHKAYVPRFQADDVLIVDPTGPTVTGSIDVSVALAGEDPSFTASPGRALLAGGRVYLALEGYAPGFINGSAESRVVAIDPETDSVADVLVLSGVHSCGALAIAPDESEIALGCSGIWSGADEPDPRTSFVVRVGIVAGLEELARISALDLGGAPFGQALDYAAPSTLVATRLGRKDGRRDTLVEIDTATGALRELLTSDAFSLSDVRCAASCGSCFVSDAARGVLHRFEVVDGSLGPPQAFVADTLIGLPPRYIGRF